MQTESAKLFKRAHRAARNVTNGSAILDVLAQPTSRTLLVEGVKEGVPPVVKIASLLLQQGYARADLTSFPVKAFIGQVVRAVLVDEGYDRVERGVRTGTLGKPDHLFTTGSVYAKINVAPGDKDDGNDDLINLLVAVANKVLTAPARTKLIKRLAA